MRRLYQYRRCDVGVGCGCPPYLEVIGDVVVFCSGLAGYATLFLITGWRRHRALAFFETVASRYGLVFGVCRHLTEFLVVTGMSRMRGRQDRMDDRCGDSSTDVGAL